MAAAEEEEEEVRGGRQRTCWVTHTLTEEREAANCYETSLLGEHLWDAGGSKSGKCDCSLIKAQNGGGP